MVTGWMLSSRASTTMARPGGTGTAGVSCVPMAADGTDMMRARVAESAVRGAGLPSPRRGLPGHAVQERRICMKMARIALQ
ncbi:hypothetical protein ALDI51_14710 [Alicycliphilus denitrificans]|nr:hypothetical protein ALDI51_14710 [Alicycliphilus denitrificans]